MQTHRINNLVEERNEWAVQYEEGLRCRPGMLITYEANRDSELWRMSRQHEKLCEYTLWLERKIGGCLHSWVAGFSSSQGKCLVCALCKETIACE